MNLKSFHPNVSSPTRFRRLECTNFAQFLSLFFCSLQRSICPQWIPSISRHPSSVSLSINHTWTELSDYDRCFERVRATANIHLIETQVWKQKTNEEKKARMKNACRQAVQTYMWTTCTHWIDGSVETQDRLVCMPIDTHFDIFTFLPHISFILPTRLSDQIENPDGQRRKYEWCSRPPPRLLTF